MKTVFFFAIFAVIAYGVKSKNLFDAIPRDIELPALTTPKTRRTGTGRIVGGTEISQNDRKSYKYQVLLISEKRNGKTYLCGGSIISERCIVTAAHCFDDKISTTVYIGIHDQGKPDSAEQAIKITKEDWKQHPDYDRDGYANDVAIINLPEAIKFGEFAGPIEVECDDRQRHENEIVSVSGWGQYEANMLSPILRAAKVQTAPNHVCQSVYPYFFVQSSMICVYGTNTVGICGGDSGGPIVSTVNGKIFGVTSFGRDIACSEDNYPRVFTRLSAFAEWIQDNTVDHIKNC